MTRSTRRQPGTQGVGGSVQVLALVVVCTSHLALPLLQVAGGGAQATGGGAQADGDDAQSAIPGVEKWGVGHGKTKWNNQCEFCNEGGTLEMCYGCNLVCHKECAEEVGA